MKLTGFPIAGLRSALAVLVLTLGLGGCKFGSPVSFLDDEEAVTKAVSGIQSRYYGPIPTLKIVIGDREMILQARDPSMPWQISEWRLVREQYHFLNYDRVYGPTKVGNLAGSRNLDTRLFNLREIDFASWSRIADSAAARAALREKGGVSSIELSRPAAAAPSKSGSPARWTIEVRSTLETVRVYANGDGEIVRVAVAPPAGTPLNLYTRPELAEEAAAEMRTQVGTSPVLKRVSFNSSSISFTTTIKSENSPVKFSGSSGMRMTAVYNWTPEGLREGMSTIDVGSVFSNPDAPFGVEELNWSMLPGIVADARAALAMPQGRIVSIDASKPTDGVGALAALWKIEIEENRERGTFVADARGVVRKVLLPQSRRVKTNWLEPAVIAETLKRIGAEFGPDTRFDSILIHDSHVNIVAEDPRRPDELAQVHLRDTGFSRFGKPMFVVRADQRFRLEDMQLSGEQWTSMVEQTLQAKKLPPGSLSRITIGREHMRAKGVPIELRAESQGIGSRIVFEAEGSTVRAALP